MAGITLSKRKFEIGQSIGFAGYQLSLDGIKPDVRKLRGISDFPIPTDVSKLRSFLGLANQLSNFIPNLANLTNPLRMLLRKESLFTWLREHTQAFKEIKAALTKSLGLHHFDQEAPTYLVTDASCLHSLGFVLMQSKASLTQPDRIIQCRSRCLNSTEKNYATIELESLAMAWALHKCEYFLHGMNSFQVVTDHRPLVGIFKKPLCDISNPCLVSIREKMLPHTFEVIWLEGRFNAIADALSRSPVDEEDVPFIRSYVLASNDLAKRMQDEAASCIEYKTIHEAWKNGIAATDLPPDHPARRLQDIWQRLSLLDDGLILVMDNKRILVPRGMRKEVLKLLHEGHSGMSQTYATAKQRYFWPGIQNDIANVVNKCEGCQIYCTSLPQDNQIPTKAFYPMERVAVDLFQ